VPPDQVLHPSLALHLTQLEAALLDFSELRALWDCTFNHAQTLESVNLTVTDLAGSRAGSRPAVTPRTALRSLKLRVVGTLSSIVVANDIMNYFMSSAKHTSRQLPMALVWTFAGEQYSTGNRLRAAERDFNRELTGVCFWDTIAATSEKVQQMVVRFESGDPGCPIYVNDTTDIENTVQAGVASAGGCVIPVQFDCTTYGPLLLWD
jgi:hypothetical protein